MTYMKRKNAGLSSVEIIIAAVILVAVIVGILVAVKLSNRRNSTTPDAEKAATIAETLLKQLDGYARVSDLDISSDEKNYIRLVGKSKTYIFYFDSASKKVYLAEKDSSAYGSSDDAIRSGAKADTPEVGSMSEVAANVQTFVIELVEADTINGRMKATVRTQVGSENALRKAGPDKEDFMPEIPLVNELKVYFAKRAGHELQLPTSTPTPEATATNTPVPTTKPSDTPTPTQAPEETPTPTPEATPEPTPEATPTETPAPTETPTPAPTEAPTATPTPKIELGKVTWLEQNPQSNAGYVYVNRTVFLKKDSMIQIVVRRSSEEDTAYKMGDTIGGIGFDNWNPTPPYIFVLQSNPEYDEEIYFEYPLQELLDAAKTAGNASKWCIKIDDASGYSYEGTRCVEKE